MTHSELLLFIKNYFTENIGYNNFIKYIITILDNCPKPYKGITNDGKYIEGIFEENPNWNATINYTLGIYDKNNKAIIYISSEDKYRPYTREITEMILNYVESLNEEEFYNEFKIKTITFANKQIEKRMEFFANKFKENMPNIKFDVYDFSYLSYVVPKELSDSITAFLSLKSTLDN